MNEDDLRRKIRLLEERIEYLEGALSQAQRELAGARTKEVHLKEKLLSVMGSVLIDG